MDKAPRAKHLLVHYFRLIAQRADIRWDGDNDAEIEDVVDLIIEAAAERAQTMPKIVELRQGEK